MSADLLYEIGVEEIPANAVLPALEQLQEALGQGLEAARLSADSITTYGTPRRLAVIAEGIPERQPDSVERYKGPPAQQAFDEQGNPTQAAEGFARSRHVDVADLEIRDTDKGQFVFAQVRQAGQPAAEVLPELLRQVTLHLNFPKTMRWGEVDIEFARPIRWLVALLGEAVLDLEIAGIRAARSSRGHRVMGERTVAIPSPAEYEECLAENGVIVDHRQRQEMILQQASELVLEGGGRLRIDSDFLTEVNFLVEYPTCIRGAFDPRYLELPTEVVVTVLEGHQKVFSLEDDAGELLPTFIAVTNAAPEAADTVREGWERVIVPRLDDAEFYYQQDTRQPLSARLESLKRVTFLKGLGNLYQKTQRLEQLAAWLYERLVSRDEELRATVHRAAQLCKCDLVTMMVRDLKLAELQGVIGGHYARASGEPEPVAAAIAEHYGPQGPEDAIPTSPAGRLLSIADKIDNLAACFRLGLIPSGSADPHGLRRQAMGIVEIIIATDYSFSLMELIDYALRLLPTSPPDQETLSIEEAGAELKQFFAGRIQAAWEQRGIAYDISRAVLAVPWDDITAATRRATVLADMRRDNPEAFTELVTAAERPARITRPETIPALAAVDPSLFEHPMETTLLKEFQVTNQQVQEACSGPEPDYAAAAASLRRLLPPIHQYFEDVMVMVEDERLRLNRLALLAQIDELFCTLADFLEIVQPGS